jgi:hypothetical protein
MMDEYFYDWGWQIDDNLKTAFRKNVKNEHYRVFKHYKSGRTEAVTDTMSREEAIERCKQIDLLDPVGQVDWIDKWHEAEQERKEQRNNYLQAKGRL